MSRWAWLLPPLLAAALYAGALRAELVWDDVTVQREQIVAFHGVRDAFFPPAGVHEWATAYYRPIVMLTYMLDHALFGREATVGPHATVVVIHVLVTLFVWLLARRVLGATPASEAGALLAAAVFAAHPIHTESVCWITGRSDPLAAVFMVPAVVLALRHRDDGGRLALVGSALLYLCALLAKEVALATPLVVALLWAILPSPRRVRPLPLAVLYGAATGVYFLLRYGADSDYGQAPGDTLAALARLPAAAAWYAWKVVVPAPQSHFVGGLPAAGYGLLGVAALLGLLVVALYVARHGAPALLAGTGWFLLTLAPSLGVVLRGVTDTVLAERYLYVPSVGLCLVLGGALAAALRHASLRIPAVAAALVLTAAYAYGTVQRARVWQDDMALWTDATVKAPDASLPWLNRGMVFMQRWESEAAIVDFRRALEAHGDAESRSLAHNNLGMALFRLGRNGEAEAEFRAAIRARPRYETPYYGLGLLALRRDADAFTRSGAHDVDALVTARGLFAQALAIAPQYVWALARLAECDMRLADARLRAGDPAGTRAALVSARATLERVVRLDPAFRLNEEPARTVIANIDAELRRLGP
jgi:tetratricopeptide (TPR) repeat protein